ncbi:MAG: SigE family RNA polymerase sigma factor [Actinocatenispora sp.]
MNDRGADFDEFVRSRSAALLRSAYLLTTDRHAAEDLLQEVLERMYVRWRRIRGAPEAYARRTLTNQAINRWRRRSRRVQEAPLHDRSDVAGRDDPAETVAARRTVLGALRELPPRQRAAVVLRYLDDLSEADTARAMGCSVGAVKSHTSRGLTHLRTVLPDASFHSIDTEERSHQ